MRMLLFIQPRDDAFCTVKHKCKAMSKRGTVMHWYECSKCGYTFSKGIGLREEDALHVLPPVCPRCERHILYWT